MDWIIRCLASPSLGLDPLRELDLLGGGQQRMAAGLAQEELQRVGGRLPGDLQRLRRRLRLGERLAVLVDVQDHVDRAGLELAVDGVGLERIAVERLEHLVQLGLAQIAALLGRVDQLAQVVAQEEDVRLRRHARFI